MVIGAECENVINYIIWVFGGFNYTKITSDTRGIGKAANKRVPSTTQPFGTFSCLHHLPCSVPNTPHPSHTSLSDLQVQRPHAPASEKVWVPSPTTEWRAVSATLGLGHVPVCPVLSWLLLSEWRWHPHLHGSGVWLIQGNLPLHFHWPQVTLTQPAILVSYKVGQVNSIWLVSGSCLETLGK